MYENLDDFLLYGDPGDENGSVVSYEPEEITVARIEDRRGRKIEVLILVKTAPQPSESYIETVCVAGIALDPLRLVRLYPIPFRNAEEENRFKKYSIIEVEVKDSPKDPRYESLKVDIHSICTKRQLEKWKQRAYYVEDVPHVTMCELIERVVSDVNATSLGIVEPAEVIGIEITPHEGWTPKQQRVIDLHQTRSQQATLYGTPERIPLLLPPAYEVHLNYKCKAPTCKGHRQGILDWELRALQRNYHDQASEQLKEIIKDKFFTNPTKKEKRLLLFVGNQANATRRRIFSILGMYYPTERDAQPGLF